MTRRLLLGLWTALLPASEREPFLARVPFAVPTVPVSWALGALQVALIPVWALVGVSFGREVVSVQTETILAQERPPSFTEAMLASVAFGPLAFVVSPLGLFLEYVILTGVVRLAGLVAFDRPTGDPIVTLLAWLRRTGSAEWRRRKRLRELGPWRPERVLEDGTGLVVLSSRDQPDWNERVTFGYRGRFYRLLRREDRPHEHGTDVAYVLRRQQAGELIRTLVELESQVSGEERT